MFSLTQNQLLQAVVIIYITIVISLQRVEIKKKSVKSECLSFRMMYVSSTSAISVVFGAQVVKNALREIFLFDIDHSITFVFDNIRLSACTTDRNKICIKHHTRSYHCLTLSFSESKMKENKTDKYSPYSLRKPMFVAFLAFFRYVAKHLLAPLERLKQVLVMLSVHILYDNAQD